MFQNYLKIAWRNLWKRRFYSLVSITGLAVGMTFTLLISSFIWGELQVNARLRHADRQYIVRSRWKQPDMGYEDATLAPLGKTLNEQYPGLVANYYNAELAAKLRVPHRHQSAVIRGCGAIICIGYRAAGESANVESRLNEPCDEFAE